MVWRNTLLRALAFGMISAEIGAHWGATGRYWAGLLGMVVGAVVGAWLGRCLRDT